MIALNEQYIVDGTGTRVGVVLQMDEYRRLLEALEELVCTQAYDAAKASGETPIPFDQAMANAECSSSQ